MIMAVKVRVCLVVIVWAVFCCLLPKMCPTTYAYIPKVTQNTTLTSTTATPTRSSPRGMLPPEARNVFLPDPKQWNCLCFNRSLESPPQCNCNGMDLVRVPQNMMSLSMERLTMMEVGIVTLRTAALAKYSNLTDLTLDVMPKFKGIEDGAFQSLPHLRTIYILDAPQLQVVSADAFRGISKALKLLRIVNCGLVEVPDLSHLSRTEIISMVDLEGNRISSIEKKSIMLKTDQLVLANNELIKVGANAFHGSSIGRLSLRGNKKLVDIHRSAFSGMVFLKELDLSDTNVVAIPDEGLDKLEVLRIQNTQSLKIIPSMFNFKSLQEAHLTHPFHCCAFIFPSRHDPENYVKELSKLQRYQEQCNSQKRSRRDVFNDSVSTEAGQDKTDSTFMDETSDEWDDDYTPSTNEGTFHNGSAVTVGRFSECGNLSITSHVVKCYPQPDALNPCEDVMGSHWLRASVWIVVSFTVFGNISVLVVILSSRSGVSVFKFLISNLAFADLCMGLYLLLVASMDVHSIGEYFNFAFDWQYGLGCQTAGFLTVFASNLSVYTLTVITIERWLTITYAIYLNKRIKLRTAICIMIGGWSYSIAIALLPLFGFSNYSSTSICLPMELRDWFDISYLLSLLLSSGLAFIIIAISYSRIYFSLGRETRQAEMAVAKKMILLVFTNFACWAPIAFFALTAIAGFPLIDVAKSKILLVFFYPLNSCANPYLYAIITTQYRKDLFSLLSKCGLCVKRAQNYKISYSIPSAPTINQNGPLMSTNSSISSGRKKECQDYNGGGGGVDGAFITPMIEGDRKCLELQRTTASETEM